jgi:3',5'-cyclic AMP phosphodiesterase CpdA
VSIGLLHLSDLHYESPDSNFQDDDKSFVPPALRQSAFGNLLSILSNCFASSRFDLVAITGDITTHGKASGFAASQKKLIPALQKLVPAPDAIHICPGNHDVTWGLDREKADYFTKKFEAFRALAEAMQATCSLIPEGSIPADLNEPLSYATTVRGPVRVDSEKRLLTLCINSSIRCGEVNTGLRTKLIEPLNQIAGVLNKLEDDVQIRIALAHLSDLQKRLNKSTVFDIAHVTFPQVDELRGRLEKVRAETGSEWDHYTKIAVMHHHLAPFHYQVPEYKDFELTADAASVLDLLGGYDFDCVLTGHKHQPYITKWRSSKRETLIIGGMTIGGFPVPGYYQGFRHIVIQRMPGITHFRIADIPCTGHGDICSTVAEQLSRAGQEQCIRDGGTNHRVAFPPAIERAVDEELYGLPFYKSDVVYHIQVSRAADRRLLFVTTLSYRVVNRSNNADWWYLDYRFKYETGTVRAIRFNDAAIDPRLNEIKAARGVRVAQRLEPGEEGRIFFEVDEYFEAHGSELYTSYYPATDLRVVIENHTSDIEFDPEVLYHTPVLPTRQNQVTEVSIKTGILPYHGIRLNWKESDSDEPDR